ncbi:MAG TPA: NAD-dependent epimerase/dehydratase family protein [Thermoleophilaceae bacterium]|nr:NAD-dependent epimerase/dehydratase family protein [Thermoleophilaceae bacterium]
MQPERSSGRRVCVTGGLGFVGSRVCALLADRGYEVVCVDRQSAAYSPGAGPDAARSLSARGSVRLLVEDVAQVDLADLLGPAAGVIHLAALPGVRSGHDAETLWRENVALSERVARAAARSGTRMVLASSSSVYGNAACLPTPETATPRPLGVYGESKAAAEAACLGAAPDVVVARLFTVFGPGQRPDMALSRWIRALRGGEPLDWRVHAGGARELTYVDDAARGLVAALERGRAGEAYNIGGCGSYPMEQVLRLLERELGRRARLERHAAGLQEAVRTAACLAKSERELGHRPRVGLVEGLRTQLASVGALGAHAEGRPPRRHARVGALTPDV